MIGKIATLASGTSTHRSTLQVGGGKAEAAQDGTAQQTWHRMGSARWNEGAAHSKLFSNPLLQQKVEVHRLVWFVGILAFTMGLILFAVGLGRKMNPLSGG
jgi:hypothetical protein